jgi:hypothetical protein
VNSLDASAVDVPAAPVCFGTIVPICFPASAVPSAPRTLSTVDIDTDLMGSASLCDQTNDRKAAYCVVAGTGIALPAGETVSAHGSKPLVLLSSGTMNLLGSIDVSSHLTGGAPRGAGANPTDLTACVFATRAVAATMGGGAAGASFGTQGGAGGIPPGSATGGGFAGSPLDTFPAVLRGGCRGNDGSAASGSPPAGGNGGGAVALIAATEIQVDALINASGSGGKGGGGGAVNGAGGGGSGGMIVFDSPQPLVFGANVKLWANGGSGGQGGSVTTAGAPGAESNSPFNSAHPMNVSGAGGVGADGAVATFIGGKGGNGPAGGGGGGGGGGCGFIHAPGLTDPAAISPPLSG